MLVRYPANAHSEIFSTLGTQRKVVDWMNDIESA